MNQLQIPAQLWKEDFIYIIDIDHFVDENHTYLIEYEAKDGWQIHKSDMSSHFWPHHRTGHYVRS